MLRPYIVFATVICCFLGIQALDLTPGSTQAILFLACVPIIACGVWFSLGRLLNHFEFVRLISFDNQAGTTTIRFETEELARRAREALVEAT
jgi:hypothetical protein